MNKEKYSEAGEENKKMRVNGATQATVYIKMLYYIDGEKGN